MRPRAVPPVERDDQSDGGEIRVSDDKYGGEEVLVVPTILFHEVGYFEGFSSNLRPYLDTLFDGAHTRFLPRRDAEDDPSFKQLIPYCLFRHAGEVFHYQRGEGVGEDRLLGKRSVGIGGHISSDDTGGGEHPYQTGMQREIDEEIEIRTGFQESMVGLINDDQSPVGRVHLGVVHVFDLESPDVSLRETELKGRGFAKPDELLAAGDEFESWSRICLEYLAGRQDV